MKLDDDLERIERKIDRLQLWLVEEHAASRGWTFVKSTHRHIEQAMRMKEESRYPHWNLAHEEIPDE